jgi:hypothetical protein
MEARQLSRTIWSLPFELVLCASTQSYFRVCDDISLPKKYRTAFPAIDGEAFTVREHNRAYVDCMDTVLVVIRPCEDHAKIRSHLVHEAVHVWQYHADLLGEDKPGAESMAYGIQNIYGQLIGEYGRQLKISI